MVNFHSLHVRILTDKHLLCSSDKTKQICFIHRRFIEIQRLSENQRNQAIGMLQAGAMVNDVAQYFGRSRQTIHKSIPGLQSLVPIAIVRVLVNVV